MKQNSSIDLRKPSVKHKISVEIHKKGYFNDDILKMVTTFNEGVFDWPLTDTIIKYYMKAEKYKYPNITPDFSTFSKSLGNHLHIYENGVATISLYWKDYYDLVDDIPSTLFNGEQERDADFPLLNIDK